MRSAPLAAAVVAGALALAADLRRPAHVVTQADAEPVRRPVGRCVRFSQTLAGDDEVVLRLASRCAFPIACDLSWVVRCDGGDTRGEASVVLERGDASTHTASAASCAGDWELDEVRWSCAKAP